MEMRLPVPPGAWLPPGLLLLMLLLGAVCGVPVKPQSPGTPPRNFSKQAEVSESGEQRGPDPGHSANSDWDFLMVWTPWSPCSRTCGKGTQSRSRSCGYACVTSETQSCRLWPCPGTKDKDPKNPKNPDDQAMDSRQLTRPLGLDIPPSDANVCDKLLSCRSDLLLQYLDQMLQSLPSCPCHYPEDARLGVVKLYDWRLGREFKWQDASGPQDFLAVYRPAARFCLRSVLEVDSPTLAAQQCCYDAKGLLLTRGRKAGYPELFSPSFSPDQDVPADRLPWVLCKGDWSRYQGTLPPDNGLSCPEHPPRKQDQEHWVEWTREVLGI